MVTELAIAPKAVSPFTWRIPELTITPPEKVFGAVTIKAVVPAPPTVREEAPEIAPDKVIVIFCGIFVAKLLKRLRGAEMVLPVVVATIDALPVDTEKVNVPVVDEIVAPGEGVVLN